MIAAKTAKRMPGARGAQRRSPAAQPDDDDQCEETNRERPEIGLPQLRHNRAYLLDKAIGVDGKAKQFGQLTNHDRDR
jgi:hypothetical protein